MRAERSGPRRRALVLASSLVAAGALLGCAVYAYGRLQPFGAARQLWCARRGQSRLSRFGEIGAMLSGALGPPLPSAAAATAAGTHVGSGRIVEVDSEVD
ncbi:hypothetical protein CDD83_2688 [Cordyceps sp. RAO-2017]|nr:hypothetical protein CDD83_2688 [Cordyceps sp. RAO-2017]